MKRYYASKNYVLRKIAGESVLVSVGEGIADFCGIVKLNDSAAVLWEDLQKGAAEEELRSNLRKRFMISEDRAAKDVAQALEVLKEHGMITYE